MDNLKREVQQQSEPVEKAVKLQLVKNVDSVIDPEVAIVLAWIAAKNAAGEGDAELEALLIECYVKREYYKQSNGCTLVSELGWPFRHPPCCAHDMLYNDQVGKWLADKLYQRLNAYFGHSGAGLRRRVGLTFLGWPAYWKSA